VRRAVLIVLGLVFAVVAAGLPFTASAATSRFSDVPVGAPYYADIEWLAAEGIAQGNPDGTFRPKANVTRQAMAVFLYHFANPGQAVPPCLRAPYPDVPKRSAYCGSITWLGQAGITRGTASGTFDPLGPVTRQSMASFLYHLRYGGAAAPACSKDAYADVPKSSPFCGSIAWLYRQGVTTGNPAGNFGPSTPVSRGMMAAFLHRYDVNLNALTGSDVSYPQCNKPLPTGQAFGIVGVNGGKPTTWNSCLSQQLAWAANSAGGTSQPKVQLYVNTANPGPASPNWPTTGTSPYDNGTCTGLNDAVCAYQYGKARAAEDLAKITGPGNYVWWLDAEIDPTGKTGNTWDTTAGGTQRNVAVLEGMVDALHAGGVGTVGLYSTANQWKLITGTGDLSGSPLAGLKTWLAGGTGIGDAKRRCDDQPPLTPNGDVVLSQYVDGFDRNVACA
jgi:hypothetical protein